MDAVERSEGLGRSWRKADAPDTCIEQPFGAAGAARISVVVPVYNSEAHLGECLDSLQCQTEHALQIVCVDDGSTDGSADLLSRAAEEDDRICVVAQANAGVSAARNAGIDHATAPYTCFVDADDTLEPDACARMLQVLERSRADVLVFGGKGVPEDREPAWVHLVLSPRDVEYEGFDPAIVFKEQSRPYVWKTAYRTGFLRGSGVRFDERLAIGEDQAFLFDILPQSGKTVFISDRLYNYRLPLEDSAMAKLDDPRELIKRQISLADRVFASWQRMDMLERYSEDLLSWFADMVIFEAMKLGDGEYAELADQATEVLRSHWGDLQNVAASLPGPLRGMVDAVLHKTAHRSPLKRRYLMLRYYVWLNGVGKICERLTRKR